MKQFQLLIALLLTYCTYAQVPANYYNSANGLSGYALKTELKNITSNGHITRTYDQLRDGIGIPNSQGYIDTHSDIDVTGGANYENDGTILDFYSENPTGNDPYNFNHGIMQCGNQSAEGDCYNREHLVPGSSYENSDGSDGYPMYSDIHHVIPTDGRVNNFRGTLPFGIVASPNWTSLNGSKRGSSGVTGYSGVMFEPIDEFKGDIARALLYFATRYEDTVDGYTSFDMFNGTNDEVFFSWAITTLLDWHNNVDPVDDRERVRNDEAYNFQNNANPFVDHPEYADMIWNPTTDTQAPTVPTNLMTLNPSTSTIDLSWTASTDNVGVTSYNVFVDGVFYATTPTNATTYTVTGLSPDTQYTFTVLANDGFGNTSVQSAQATGTTLAGNTSTNELFFSEYLEGSSSNKALEIANFTGANITNLSDYEIRLSSNGNAAWTNIYNFTSSASISNNDVYVVANGGLAVCTGVVDNANNSITGFNGNDAIGLFKNGALIDIIGTLGNNTDFAVNTTLVRNANIAGGNTVFDSNEWTSFASNTCDNLGQHSQSLSISEVNKKEFKIYPNPVNGNLLTIENSQNTRFEIYNILGKKILTGTITPNNNKVSVSSLSNGVYILKLNNNNGSVTKKLIKE